MPVGTVPPPRRQPVSYEDRLARRALADIDLVVVHCTELPDFASARTYAERVVYAGSGTGNCGHYYIGRDGTTFEYVSPQWVAHHCVGVNARAIGIELDHPGRWPDWLDARHQRITLPYPEPQIAALLHLLTAHLRPLLPALRWIAGHEELDQRRVPASADPALEVHRKRDPGESFPWPVVETASAGWLAHALPPDVQPLI